ncbi:MAG: electron transport complex subunit RsxC [Rhodanobacteraceae bacterium]|nr:electron transport complex subunit RsxC [Rhodanobacteraceae bacterium]
MSLHRIHGGLAAAALPHAGEPAAVRPCPLPRRLYLPLTETDGGPLYCRVSPGQQVRRGEALAHAADALATILPAPTSGCIVAIQDHALARSDGSLAPHLVLEPDGRDEPLLLPPMADWAQADPQQLRRRLAEAGVIGLGGAGFATAQKLARPVSTLILNGAECEPYISCDQALLQERAADVVAGAGLLARIAGARQIIIALQDRMLAAADALRAALVNVPGITLAQVPTVYPQGGERQLIEVLCGREVPAGSWPVDIGIAVQNVATAAAAWRAVALGEAMTTRLISLAGRGVVSGGVFEVRIGATIATLIEAAGGYAPDAARLVLGGPLMGISLPHDEVALTRTSNAILVLAAAELRPPAPEQACIRCGDCATACPVRLQPQELLRLLRADDAEGAADLGLAECIECGCCAFVCPAQIPLVDIYRQAKTAQAIARTARTRADQARERYRARGQRLAREQAEKVARVAARRDALAQEQAAANLPTPATADAAPVPAARMDKSAVLAAIARGKAKRTNANGPRAGAPQSPGETS